MLIFFQCIRLVWFVFFAALVYSPSLCLSVLLESELIIMFFHEMNHQVAKLTVWPLFFQQCVHQTSSNCGRRCPECRLLRTPLNRPRAWTWAPTVLILPQASPKLPVLTFLCTACPTDRATPQRETGQGCLRGIYFFPIAALLVFAFVCSDLLFSISHSNYPTPLFGGW